MANLDTGHIFLTTLAPIKSSSDGGREHTSFEQNVRVALAELPTALQSPATQHTKLNSPFARNRRNHLARMFVLNDVVYNGRVGKNAIAAIIAHEDPIDPKPVDRLNCAYLVFCAEIDAVTEDGAPLPTDLSPAKQKAVRQSYARELWDTMGEELSDIYGNCVGFEGVKTADDFAAYLDKCHVETTMPFHDYYLKLPKFHTLPVWPLAAAVGLPAIVAAVALLLRILGYLTVPFLGWNTFWTFAIALVLAAIAALLAIRYAIANGEKPLAPGEYDDLPSVLKGLYLQQKFADFAVDNQGVSDADLHANFGNFLKSHKPGDKSDPTQAPGVISSDRADQPASAP